MANQKEKQIANELFELIEESLEDIGTFWSRYRLFLVQFQFLRTELNDRLPELHDIVIAQLEELIDNWKQEIHPQPKLEA